MAFLFGLRTLLECLRKADKGREERDHSGQELHELSKIGHGHHLPSDGGLCPARGLPPARTILSERLVPPVNSYSTPSPNCEHGRIGTGWQRARAPTMSFPKLARDRPRSRLLHPRASGRARNQSSRRRSQRSSYRLPGRSLHALGAFVPSQGIRPQACWLLSRTG